MIHIRPRRLRTTPAMRRLVREVEVRPSQLVLPMFVAERRGDISSMPGVVRHDLDSLRAAAEEAVAAGIGGLMLFGVPDDDAKDDLLPLVLDAHDGQAVEDGLDGDGTNDGAEDRRATAAKRGAADDGCGDGVHLVALAEGRLCSG